MFLDIAELHHVITVLYQSFALSDVLFGREYFGVLSDICFQLAPNPLRVQLDILEGPIPAANGEVFSL